MEIGGDILDRIASGLSLPARKAGPVIRQPEGKPHGWRETTTPSANFAEHGTGLLLLRAIASTDHFLEQFARAFLVANFFIG